MPQHQPHSLSYDDTVVVMVLVILTMPMMLLLLMMIMMSMMLTIHNDDVYVIIVVFVIILSVHATPATPFLVLMHLQRNERISLLTSPPLPSDSAAAPPAADAAEPSLSAQELMVCT